MDHTIRNHLVRKLPFFGVLLLGLAQCFYNFIWRQEASQTYPLLFDQARYIHRGIIYTQTLKDGGGMEFLRAVFTVDPAQAPLYSLSMVPVFLLGGYSPLLAYLVTLIYLLFFLVAVYWLGQTLGGPWVGVLSAVILSGAASFINYGRDYLMEFPLAALITFTLLCLVKARNFSSLRWSALAGVGAGLCLMMKTMAVGFLAAMMLYPLYKWGRDPDKKSKVPSLAVMGALGLLVAGPFYIKNFRVVFWYLFHFGFGPGAAPWTPVKTFWSFQNFYYYLSSLIQNFFSPPFFLLLSALIIYRLLARERPWKWGDESEATEGFKLLGVFLVGGYLLLTVTTIKEGSRFALPLFGPLAVITAQFLGDIRTRTIKILVLILTTIIITINYASLMVQPFTFTKPIEILSYKIFPLPSYVEKMFRTYYEDPGFRRDARGRPLLRYEDWGFPALVKVLEEERKKESYDKIKINTFAHHPLLNNNSLGLYGELAGAKILFQGVDFLEGEVSAFAESPQVRYLLLKEGGEQFAAAPKIDLLAQDLRQRNQEYFLLAELPLPDGSRAVIYKKAPWRRVYALPQIKVNKTVPLGKNLTFAGADFYRSEPVYIICYWRGEPQSLKGTKRDLLLTSKTGKVTEISLGLRQDLSKIGGKGSYLEEYKVIPWKEKKKGEIFSLILRINKGDASTVIPLGKVKAP